MSERGWKVARTARRFIGAGPALDVDAVWHPSRRPRARHMWSGWPGAGCHPPLDAGWDWLRQRMWTGIPF